MVLLENGSFLVEPILTRRSKCGYENAYILVDSTKPRLCIHRYFKIALTC